MTYTEAQQKRVVACASRGIRDVDDLEAHRAWAGWLLGIGHRPDWLQQEIKAAAARLGVRDV